MKRSIRDMKKELEQRFRLANSDCPTVKIVWVGKFRAITFPTGLKRYHGEFRAIADGYRDYIHWCSFTLDGRFDYFN